MTGERRANNRTEGSRQPVAAVLPREMHFVFWCVPLQASAQQHAYLQDEGLAEEEVELESPADGEDAAPTPHDKRPVGPRVFEYPLA